MKKSDADLRSSVSEELDFDPALDSSLITINVMKIAIVGAAGNVGRRLTDEALRRGHSVVAVGRSADQGAPRQNVTWVSADANDPRALSAAIKGSDVVISSIPFKITDPERLIAGVRDAGLKRYYVVGGAGSLNDPDGGLHYESEHFKTHFGFAYEEAQRGKLFLDALDAHAADLEWTMLSPSVLFTAGERTGKFRLGTDFLLFTDDGKSWISFEDFAVALFDEIEHPAHVRQRFTVGY